MKKKLVYFLCCYIVAISFCTCGIFKKYPDAVLSDTTVATFLEYKSYPHNGEYMWEVIINGKKSVLQGEGALMEEVGAGDVRGTKRIMVYDSLNFTKYGLIYYTQILPYSPIFIKGEKTATSIGIIEESHFKRKKKNTKILYKIEDYVIVETIFKVQINGVWYEHWQYNDVNSNFVLPKKGDQFEVEYWLENPHIVVLYLDKPINNNLPVKENDCKTEYTVENKKYKNGRKCYEYFKCKDTYVKIMYYKKDGTFYRSLERYYNTNDTTIIDNQYRRNHNKKYYHKFVTTKGKTEEDYIGYRFGGVKLVEYKKVNGEMIERKIYDSYGKITTK